MPVKIVYLIAVSADLTTDRKNHLLSFLKPLKLAVKDLSLLNNSFIHSSFLKENNKKNLEDNERLEFFGDAVLKLIISEYLMKNYSHFSEGELSKSRAFVISEKVLVKIAAKLDLKKYILVGKNEKRSMPVSILADSVEALIAVIYYECGIDAARKFIYEHFKEFIELVGENTEIDNYKAVLQEYTQKYKLGLPVYKTMSEFGPEHNKEFEVVVELNNSKLAQGKGKTKKEASQFAAKNALEVINKFKK